jgi:hypothetical protein
VRRHEAKSNARRQKGRAQAAMRSRHPLIVPRAALEES